MMKIKTRMEDIPFINLVSKISKICTLFMLIFFGITILSIARHNFGRESHCAVVNALDAFFDDKSSGFLKHFTPGRRTELLDNFNSDLKLWDEKQNKFPDEMLKHNFIELSRNLKLDLKNFVKKYKNRTFK